MAYSQFDGFSALSGIRRERHWREVLNLVGEPKPTADQIAHHYRLRAKKAHPDAGGSTAAMAELNAARDQALKEIGA